MIVQKCIAEFFRLTITEVVEGTPGQSARLFERMMNQVADGTAFLL